MKQAVGGWPPQYATILYHMVYKVESHPEVVDGVEQVGELEVSASIVQQHQLQQFTLYMHNVNIFVQQQADKPQFGQAVTKQRSIRILIQHTNYKTLSPF